MHVPVATSTSGFPEKTCDDQGCGRDCETGLLGADFDLLLDAVESQDADVVAVMIEANPSLIFLNHERSSLTVMACNGVAANLPLTDEFLQEVVA